MSAAHHAQSPALGSAVTRITFEDHHQDFLTWEIDADGYVVDCQPFQEWVWVGCRVINESLQAGDRVNYIPKWADETYEIAYPLARVEDLRDGGDS